MYIRKELLPDCYHSMSHTKYTNTFLVVYFHRFALFAFDVSNVDFSIFSKAICSNSSSSCSHICFCRTDARDN